MLVMFIGSLKLIFLITMTLYRTNISAFDTNLASTSSIKEATFQHIQVPEVGRGMLQKKALIYFQRTQLWNFRQPP